MWLSGRPNLCNRGFSYSRGYAVCAYFQKVKYSFVRAIVTFQAMGKAVPVTVPGADHFVQVIGGTTTQGVPKVRTGIIRGKKAGVGMGKAHGMARQVKALQLPERNLGSGRFLRFKNLMPRVLLCFSGTTVL